MTIEPQNVRFQIGAPVLTHKSRSVIDYRDDLRHKFGRVPSFAELAQMESGKRYAAPETNPMPPSPQLQGIRDRVAKKSRAACDLVLSRLTEPKTAAAIASEVGFSTQRVGALLRAAYERGEVARSTGTRITIWSKA